MGSICKLGLLALFIFIISVNNVRALDILYPLDQSFVVKSNYLIIKGGKDPMLDGFAVGINGVMSDIIDVTGIEYRKAFEDMLILEPLFDPGVNNIVVEGYINGERIARQEATIYYSGALDAIAPEGFKREYFHFPEREAPCAVCHIMSPTPEMLASPDPRKNACGSCHVRMLNKKHVHGPAGAFECVFCHEPQSQPNKYQARPGDAELCVECHEDKLTEYRTSEFVHGPVEAGLCMVCHDPHASDVRAQLVLPAYDLCITCHEQVPKEPHVTRGAGSGGVHPLKGVTNPAGEGEDLSCASCHDPHAAASRQLFRWDVKMRFGLCEKCHNK